MSFRVSDTQPLYYGESEYYRYSSLKGYEDEAYGHEAPAVHKGVLINKEIKLWPVWGMYFDVDNFTP